MLTVRLTGPKMSGKTEAAEILRKALEELGRTVQVVRDGERAPMLAGIDVLIIDGPASARGSANVPESL